MNAVLQQADQLLVTYTLFPHVYPKEKTVREDVPWEDLTGRIRAAATYINKTDCPLISMAEYGDQIDAAHKCLRYAENVQRVYGVELDYDGEEVPIEAAADLLQAANLRAILYTSPSHTTARPRWRALLPLCEPAIPEKRAEYVGRANRALGGIASRESFTLSQSFYIGRVRGAAYEVRETSGRTIDNASDILPQYYAGHQGNGAAPRDPTTDADLRAAFARGEDRYQAMLKLSSRWAARGMSADDIENSLLELLGAGSHNGDGIDLRTRARPMADSAVRKYGETRRAPAQDYPPPPAEETPEEEPRFKREPMRWLQLDGTEPPIRSWRVNHWLSIGSTLLAGKGGIGKTMVAQTLATAIAIGKRYLDEVTAPLKVLFWACEDDHDELWRRQIAICRYFGCTFSDIADQLVIQPRQGLENTLFYAEYGAPKWTALYGELTEQVNDYRADVTFIDNVGQTFGGKENDRHHVTAYINGLSGLGQGRPHSAVILAHPAKQVDSEFSGSTAWENCVRMRWYMGMKLPDQEPQEGEEEDPDVRYISKRKTNYTVKDYRKLTYRDGVFAPEAAPGEFTARYTMGRRNEIAEEVLLKALDKFADAEVRTTDSRTSPDYLPKKMREMKLAQDFAPRELADALNRLRLTGKISEGKVGKFANRTVKFGLVRSQ